MKKIYFLFAFLFSFGQFYYNAQVCIPFGIKDSRGNDNVLIDCNYPLSNNCLSLSATAPKTRLTNTYSVSPADFTPIIPFNSGTAINANYDDVYSKIIDLPFTFCFFGKYYNQLVIGSNGLVTFDISQIGKISYPNIGETNPNPLLPTNSIFGIFQDLAFSSNDESEIYYSVIGSGSCRKVVINFYEGRIVGCNERSSSQIVLSEFTNEIEIFIDRKPMPCSTVRFPNALMGIMNDDGTVGYTPPGRNTGVWAANKEAWKFSPSGADVSPTIEWYNAKNEMIGKGETITVCPEENTKYTAKASYNVCASQLVLEDSIDISFAPDYPIIKNFTKTFCLSSGTPENINLDDYRSFLTPQNYQLFKFQYFETRNDAQNATNPVNVNVSISTDQSYFVRVENASDTNCYRIAELKFQFLNNSLLTNTVTLCDANNDGIEKAYTLTKFNNQLFASGTSGTITYYGSSTDAQNATNSLYAADITAQTQLWVRYTTASCNKVFGPISVNFTPGPAVNTPLDYTINRCDINDDKKEPFDFKQTFNNLISLENGVTFSYYATYQEAYSGTGTVLTEVYEGKYSVFVRVVHPNGCFSVAEIRLTVSFYSVVATNRTVNICFNGTDDITVDLDALSAPMLVSPPSGITITYHNTPGDAVADINPISSNQIITDDGNIIDHNFYVRFERSADCYTIRPITITLIHPVAVQNKFVICDVENDGAETVVAAQYNNAIKGNQPADVSYFSTLSDAQAAVNPLTNIVVTGTVRVYARIKIQSCTEIYPVDFSLSPTPRVKAEHNVLLKDICDNNNDGLEIYDLTQHEKDLYSDTEPVQFTYYKAYNATTNSFSGSITNPKAYVVSTDNNVFVKVQFVNGSCFSAASLKIKLSYLPAIILSDAVLRICDNQFNFNESFNLRDAIPLMFEQVLNTVQLSDLKITFYNTLEDANNGLATKQIGNSKTTLNALTTVFARFQSNVTGCYSVKAVDLKTYFPPKAINSVIRGICDTNLDGIYEVNLLSYLRQMVDMENAENNFSFYTTEMDAQNNLNRIADPENYKISSLPARLWVKVENIPGCNDTTFVDLQAGAKVTLNNRGPFLIEPCDISNDGMEVVDLTQFEKQILSGGQFSYYPTMADLQKSSNEILNPKLFSYNAGAGAQIYVKVSTSGLCPDVVPVTIKLKKTPVVKIAEQFFCPYNGSVDIRPDFTGQDIVAYEWKNPAGKVVSTTKELLNVNIVGIYTLSVKSSNLCTFTTSFEVKHYEVPVITKLVATGNSFTVVATGSKTILYSIDGLNWQSSNVFPNLPTGTFTFYVKFDNEECIGLPKRGLILNVPNAFSPNADGINDTWKIDGLDVFDGEKSKIQVFDRQQTLVFSQESATSFIWDGKYVGRPVPTTTYWYIITLPDGRTFNGWVLLKNRN